MNASKWSGMVLALSLIGCGDPEESEAVVATTPEAAASALEQAFESAPTDVQKNAGLASEAIRSGDYERAVVSLQAIRSGEPVTLEQGLAIHSSMVTLESRLIQAMDSGDENARRAYELLRRMKRD